MIEFLTISNMNFSLDESKFKAADKTKSKTRYQIGPKMFDIEN